MKPIRLTKHAAQQCSERGTNPEEIQIAVETGTREQAKSGRTLCRANFQFDDVWNGQQYSIKQVAPVIIEEEDETVVITVYTYYF